MKTPKISIIITTKNSSPTLKPLLESIQAQVYKNHETIVVDNNSTDQTTELAEKFTSLVFNKGPERSVQRNYGASKASGKYLLFLDSDMVLTPSVLEECVALASKKDIGGIIIPEKSFGRGLWARAKILEREINAGQDYFEAARFFPRRVFDEYKGFDKKLTGPEDWDLPQRISKKYLIDRIEAKILHNEGYPTLWGFIRRKYYYGLTVHQYLKKHKISTVSPTTVYFLRPAFYKSWKRLFKDPVVSFAMVVMLIGEMIGGGIGYLKGRIKND